MCPSLRIRGQFPAPSVNGGGDSIWKWKDFQLWRARDLDLVSGHTAYRRASLIDLYLGAKFHWNRINTPTRRLTNSLTVSESQFSERTTLPSHE